jgi:7-carboxy-7-deazaguanine synthase
MTYQVNELFTSVQGEGHWTGRLATFIRLQGCTVGCPWCDSGPLADAVKGRQTNGETRNTWGKGGTRMTVEEIVSQVEAYHVVITGGEPTLYNLDPLIDALHSMNKYVSLETSGQNNLKGMLVPDWVTWSPKERLNWDAPYYIKVMADEVKWVVDEELQWETVQATWGFYTQYSPPTEVYFMPEGCPPRPEMIAKTLDWMRNKVSNDPVMMERCFISDRLQYRLSVR